MSTGELQLIDGESVLTANSPSAQQVLASETVVLRSALFGAVRAEVDLPVIQRDVCLPAGAVEAVPGVATP